MASTTSTLSQAVAPRSRKSGLRRLTLVLTILAVALANAAFVGLGAVFEYPDVLQKPPAEILADFRAEQVAIVALFTALALGAALLAPVAYLVGRIADTRLGVWSIGVGIAAAVVQVIGLSRWPLLVPGYADRNDTEALERAHDLLGTVVGETFGYLLTAAWTVLVILAFRPMPRWLAGLGVLSASLIAYGIFVPFDAPGADLGNFVGYIAWSVWLVTVAALVAMGRLGSHAPLERFHDLG